MKKKYIQPQIEGYNVELTEILAGSLEVQSLGSTNEQLTKPRNPYIEFHDYNEEDFFNQKF